MVTFSLNLYCTITSQLRVKKQSFQPKNVLLFEFFFVIQCFVQYASCTFAFVLYCVYEICRFLTYCTMYCVPLYICTSKNRIDFPERFDSKIQKCNRQQINLYFCEIESLNQGPIPLWFMKTSETFPQLNCTHRSQNRNLC